MTKRLSGFQSLTGVFLYLFHSLARSLQRKDNFIYEIVFLKFIRLV